MSVGYSETTKTCLRASIPKVSGTSEAIAPNNMFTENIGKKNQIEVGTGSFAISK